MPVNRFPTRGPALPTLPLVALAAAAVEPVLSDPTRPPWSGLVLAAVFLAVARPVRSRLQTRSPLSGRAVLAILLLVALAPPILAVAARLGTGSGNLLDVVLIESLRNLALTLAILGRNDQLDRTAALASLFLVLVAAARAEGPWLLASLAGYAILGCVWLAQASSRSVHDNRPPLVSIATAAAVVIAVITLALIGPGRAVVALAGFLPSSGGINDSDPSATHGVNDGDREVAATHNPQSIGFSESDLFLDSDRPTLYDAFNDMYGEPRRIKSQDRMIAVAANRVVELDRPPAENLRAGRDFSTIRGGPPRHARRPQDRPADALIYHEGPTPAHLPLVAYDHFDGHDWSEAPTPPRSTFLERERPDQPWFRLLHSSRSYLVPQARHRVKIARLSSPSLPLPAHIDRFRLGSVNLPSFFCWAHEGILRLADRPIPAGNTTEADAHLPRPDALRALPWPKAPPRGPSTLHPDVAALSRAWVAETPHGWPRVERLITCLREHAIHDPAATAPPDSTDVVADFLLRDRRGPDYLFATAAVLLLRDLGFHARLVSGLYVHPDRRDPAAGHTPVTTDGVHVWAEIRLPDGTWTPIEPTPGYHLAAPPRPWLLALADALAQILAEAIRHAPALGLVSALGVLLVRRRHALLDALATLLWHLNARLRPTELPWLTLALLDRRLRWAGCPRPAGVTPRCWLERLANTPPLQPARSTLRAWLALTECLLYGPIGPSPTSPAPLCARVVRAASLPRLRAAASPEIPS
ncbi:MAG: transglutaminase [Isosphaeraceae bacterium]|nr:MAG: transglutaminase [Isosphaeraceae bacterium]